MKILASALVFIASSALAGTSASKNPPGAVTPVPECPPLSYTYGEVGYIHQHFDQAASADGGYIDLSYSLVDRLFWEGSFTISGGDVDFQSYGTGLGCAIPLFKRFDFVARSGWSFTDTNKGPGENEWYVSPGIRALITCDLEFYAKAYYHVAENDNTWSGGVGFVYAVTDTIGLDIGAALGQDNDWQAQFGIRCNF